MSTTATKKTSTRTAATKKATTTTSASGLPAYKDLVKECIVQTASRDGVSRAQIKKFVEDKYKVEVTPTVNTHINTAIARGAEKGDFVLPKG